MGVEIGTYLRQIGQEEEVDEIDIECASAYILQRDANGRQLGEVLLIAAEIHEGDGEQHEACQCQGDDGPDAFEHMPFQGVHGGKDDDEGEHGEEPLAVHDPLCLVPITMHDISEEEKRKIAHHLN